MRGCGKKVGIDANEKIAIETVATSFYSYMATEPS
jgi:hypothetical protein